MRPLGTSKRPSWMEPQLGLRGLTNFHKEEHVQSRQVNPNFTKRNNNTTLGSPSPKRLRLMCCKPLQPRPHTPSISPSSRHRRHSSLRAGKNGQGAFFILRGCQCVHHHLGLQMPSPSGVPHVPGDLWRGLYFFQHRSEMLRGRHGWLLRLDTLTMIAHHILKKYVVSAIPKYHIFQPIGCAMVNPPRRKCVYVCMVNDSSRASGFLEFSLSLYLYSIKLLIFLDS